LSYKKANFVCKIENVMIKLEENKGIPRHILVMMAVIAGFSVANLYYNQPLLELIREEMNATEVEANLITVISQIGYASGLLFIIPMGDLYNRRRIILVCMITAAIMATVIGLAPQISVIWSASLILGACSVIPQLFIPVAGQFSRPENKSRNMGYVLSGLLIGILASRVISGFVGEWLGWRYMFIIAGLLMIICCVITLRMFPEMKQNFSGNYAKLMKSVVHIFATHPNIRLNSVRGAFGFGSFLAIWACLAFHLAKSPFYAGSNMVGMLGACGMAGALVSMGIGKYVPRFGVLKFSLVGASLQIISWCIALIFNDSYLGLIIAIVLCDIGLQCQQLSNQSGCIQELPEAANRVNTIFMTTYFIGGSLGTFAAGIGWNMYGWTGVCAVGCFFAVCSLAISIYKTF
jgi:predicted MFS family arabinose efflux permease